MAESTQTLLIVEDDPGLQSQMRWCFEGVDVHVADDAVKAETLLVDHGVQVVTLDLGLPPDPGGTSVGFELLEKIRRDHPAIKVIVVTGREEREHAIEAIALGAYDFYQKPVDASTLRFVVSRAFNHAELEEQHALLRRTSRENMPLDGMIASSPAMLTLCNQIKRVAASDINVLITGETGTGKEIVAANLHALSERAEGPLVTINCAAIPENLLESELFGHEKGSFTGAHARKIGKVEAANGGTLFLDEIGDMPLVLQSKILRFLQERRFERIGSNTPINADVRVVSATHRDLTGMIGAGEFREDLFYRVGEISLEVPPLHTRGTDVLIIAERLLAEHQMDRELRFSDDAVAAMRAWRWPGNVRELENRVRRAAILSENNLITARDLELEEQDAAPIRLLREVRATAESEAVQAALVRTKQNISEASRLLGVSRPTLYSLMEKYDISAVQESESSP